MNTSMQGTTAVQWVDSSRSIGQPREQVPCANLDDPQDLDLYAYVRNNPVTWVDVDERQKPLPVLLYPVVPYPHGYASPYPGPRNAAGRISREEAC